LKKQNEELIQQINDLKNENKKLKEKGCFWLKTRIKLESGRIIQMSKLQIGDRVLSNIRNGIAEFSDVYLIAHISKLEHEEKFTKVSFTRPSGSKGIFKLILIYLVKLFILTFDILAFRSIKADNHSLRFQ
jgi:hypothetical protein